MAALYTDDVERPRFDRHEQFIKYYNNKRVHMSLNYMTPKQIYARRGIHSGRIIQLFFKNKTLFNIIPIYHNILL